jgi:hypothetical protein
LVKEDNIHIKIELCKDEVSRELKVITCFDPDAPNFCKDEDGYFWCPTIEERDFLNEAFEFIPAQNQIKSHPLEKKEERFVAPMPVEPKPQVNADISPEIKPPETREEKVMFEPQAPFNKEHIKPWEKPSPIEKNDWKKPADQPPLEKN